MTRFRVVPDWFYGLAVFVVLVILGTIVVVQDTALRQVRADHDSLTGYLSERCTRDQHGALSCSPGSAPTFEVAP